MSIIKDLYIEAYEELLEEAEEAGLVIDENKIENLALEKANDRFADMCDVVKDRAKYG